MKMIAVVVVIITSIASCFRAQNWSFGFSNDGMLIGDWVQIVKCAATPYPSLSKERELAAQYYHQISTCRIMLVSRHAGWLASGSSAESDPYQPQPMVRDDDFKIDLVCDRSGLNRNGVGLIRCNVDF